MIVAMQLTNIRYIVPPVSDFRASVQIYPPLRRSSLVDYAKANQRWWLEVRFNSDVDVAIFEKTVKGSAVRLAELKGRFFIEDARLPDTATMSEVFEYASEELPRLNAAIKLLCPHYVHAQFHAVAELFPEGHGRGIVETHAVVHGAPQLDSIRAFLHGPDTNLAGIIELCSQNTDVKEALFYFGAERNPWGDLYKACEIIEDSCGGKVELLKRGWCSRSGWDRFKRTANHQEAIGAFSRHARLKAVPPPDPMPLEEARSLTRGLLSGWIQELTGRRPTALPV